MRKINHNLVPDYLTKIFTSIRSHDSTYTTSNRKITVFQNVDENFTFI